MEGLTLDKLRENVQKAISLISKESFINIIKGNYQRRKHNDKKYKEK